MSINNLTKVGLIRQPHVEQAMAWLVANGPLHRDPDLPHWILRQLVQTQRIARLRRGVYLAPLPSGELPPGPATAHLLAPEGYLSFYGALTLHDLTDQDTAQWVMVTRAHQARARAPRAQFDFVPWPARLRSARTQTRTFDGIEVRMATPLQAFSDCLEAPRFAPSFAELLHVLRDGMSLRRLSPRALVVHALKLDSPVVARRLGMLLELATEHVDPRLLELANRSHNWTRLDDRAASIREPRWRLLLPQARDRILGAAR